MLRAEMAPYCPPTLVLPRQRRRAWFWSRGKRIGPWDKTLLPTRRHDPNPRVTQQEPLRKYIFLNRPTISKLPHPTINLFSISKMLGYRECHLLCVQWGKGPVVCLCACVGFVGCVYACVCVCVCIYGHRCLYIRMPREGVRHLQYCSSPYSETRLSLNLNLLFSYADCPQSSCDPPVPPSNPELEAGLATQLLHGS